MQPATHANGYYQWARVLLLLATRVRGVCSQTRWVTNCMGPLLPPLEEQPLALVLAVVGAVDVAVVAAQRLLQSLQQVQVLLLQGLRRSQQGTPVRSMPCAIPGHCSGSRGAFGSSHAGAPGDVRAQSS